MSAPKIAIIGAGPAGLTLARLLQYNGISCIVHEREPNLKSRDQGGTLDLHPDGGLLALKEAGLYDEFLKYARPEGEVLKIYLPNGDLIMDEGNNADQARPKEMHGRPEIDRINLRTMLLESLSPESIKWGRKLQKVERVQDQDGNVTYDLHFNDGVDRGINLLVGADGAWSKVRPLITPSQPYYSGIAGYDVRITNADEREPGLAKRCGHGMCLTLGPNKGILSQKNGDGTIRTYGFMRAPESWEEESGLNFKSPETALPEFIKQNYNDWAQDAKDNVLKADLETAIPRKMWMLPVGLRWESQPNVTVLGDAAHLMTPFAGVGVNVAMQDALVLGRNIIKLRNEGVKSFASAVSDYETEMFDRAEKYATQTMMYLGLFFHERGGVAMVEHFDRVKAKEAADQAAIEIPTPIAPEQKVDTIA
ncbi:hypothetical protein FQN57_005622 [Myotisia sp. PD_48]|nr:hypothetical protein FQN57_005622 [Myotisia sp. PD_48]